VGGGMIRVCYSCGETFERLDSDFRTAPVARMFCSDCIDATDEEIVARNKRYWKAKRESAAESEHKKG